MLINLNRKLLNADEFSLTRNSLLPLKIETITFLQFPRRLNETTICLRHKKKYIFVSPLGVRLTACSLNKGRHFLFLE